MRENIIQAEDGERVERLVERAFKQLRNLGARQGAIVFAAAPNNEVVDLLAKQIERTPELQTLGLVYPSPILGFLVSSLALRAPKCRVRSFRELDEAMREIA